MRMKSLGMEGVSFLGEWAREDEDRCGPFLPPPSFPPSPLRELVVYLNTSALL